MSYKEYAMGMSFRLNPKNIRKDTFLVPFEGLSREQEMYDTYVSPLAASDEELVAGYNEGGIVEREGFANSNYMFVKKPFNENELNIFNTVNQTNYKLGDDEKIIEELGDKRYRNDKINIRSGRLTLDTVRGARVVGGSAGEYPEYIKEARKVIKPLLEKKKGGYKVLSWGTTTAKYREPELHKKLTKSGVIKVKNRQNLNQLINAALDAEKAVGESQYKQSAIVKSFLKYLDDNGTFDGGEKFDDNLNPFHRKGNTYEGIHDIWKKWKNGEIEVEGVDREKISNSHMDEINNWEPRDFNKRSKYRIAQFKTLDKLNNRKNLTIDQVREEFNTIHGEDPGFSRKTFYQRIGQLTEIKNSGGVANTNTGKAITYPGLKKGNRSPWLKQALTQTMGGNYAKLIIAADELADQGKTRRANVLYKAADEFFGPNGRLTKLKGEGEHPLARSIGGTDVELKINSLVQGDLNQFKQKNFDLPVKGLIQKYNNPNTTTKQRETIAKQIENRKTFLNTLTSTDEFGGILDPVKFEYGPNEVTWTVDVKDLNKYPKNYSFADFVQKGEAYRNAFMEKGKKFVRSGFIKPMAVTDRNITNIISQQLTEKEKNTIELVKKFNSSPGMMKMYDKELLLSIGDDFKKIGAKVAPFVKGGARVVGGILLGTTRPEVAATLAIDAMFPVSELVQGASLKEAAGASFFNQMANLFGGGIDVAKTQVDELIASGKEIGLNDQEIQRLKIIKNQFDNQVKLQDAGYELETYKIAEKERGPENIDPFFQSEYQNAEKNFNDALKTFQDYDQEQALTDYDILKRALNRKIGIRAERIPTGPQETIQDTGGLPPQLETPFLSKFEKAAMKEAGTFIPKAGTEEELSDVFLKETTGKTLQELQQQQEQATQEQTAMTELDEGLLMMNNVFEQGKQGFKKGGMVQRQGFADGPKMPRRGFLGLLAGLGTYIASLPFFKPTTKIGKEVLKQAPKVKGTPEWFPLLTDEIVKKGKDITAKAAIEDGQIVKMIEVDGDEVTGVFNRDGSIEVNVQSGDGAFEQPYTLRYDPPRADYDPNSGLIKQPGNFTVLEESPYSVVTGDPKNPDFDYEFDVDEADFGFHLSDTTRLEKHVTGKPERLIRNKTGQMPGSNNPDPVDVLVNKYGDYDDTIPDDYYD